MFDESDLNDLILKNKNIKWMIKKILFLKTSFVATSN